MSIRSNALSVGRDLSPELQDILRRNGMQAHIIRQGENYLLAVQGHDSPLLTYNISAQQMRDLADWGTNSANRKAYNTFADLVKKDFYMPRDFVHARNANGRVAMGLHGYRIGVSEYGRLPWDRQRAFMMMDPFHGRFLGWTPRNQEGFHMRRVGGASSSKEPLWFRNVLMAESNQVNYSMEAMASITKENCKIWHSSPHRMYSQIWKL